MNTADYRNASACGTCVDLEYQGRTANITVVDECPLNGPVANPTRTQYSKEVLARNHRFEIERLEIEAAPGLLGGCRAPGSHLLALSAGRTGR